MTISLPLQVVIPRTTGHGKPWILNLNGYRNTHFQTLNRVKQLYKEIVYHAVEVWGKPAKMSPPLSLIYTIFPGTKRKFDIGNVGPIVGKFTEDALVEMGIIPDDNYHYITSITYRFGGVSKDRPRVELEVK